jgi:prepilin-type N-terminal cleavage/methylation domain-containing protein
MNILRFNQTYKNNNTSTGFTLIELLVSIIITGIVSTLVGAGINFMVSSNQRLAAAQSRRVSVSQALDTIAYDIRKSENVNGSQNYTEAAGVKTITPAASVAAAIAASVTIDGALDASKWDSSYTPVLFLKIPVICTVTDTTTTPPTITATILNERVIYSIKAKVSGDGRVGPNILYRYGRISNEDDSLCGTTIIENQPIADRIIAAKTPPSCIAPTTTPATVINKSEANGFYSCVSDNQASIALFAELSDRQDNLTSANALIYGDHRTITSEAIVAPTTSISCEVPDLLNPEIAPGAADGKLDTAQLSYAGIAVTGGSVVVSQSPSAGTSLPCNKSLVTYTY